MNKFFSYSFLVYAALTLVFLFAGETLAAAFALLQTFAFIPLILKTGGFNL